MASNEKQAFELIEPPVDLREKVRLPAGRKLDFDPIERAEAALERLSVSFDHWMADEVSNLVDAWKAATQSDYGEDEAERLFRAAHDLKGQAATLGFPLVGETASNLCRLLERRTQATVPPTLIDQHVQAVSAIVRETERNATSNTARELVNSLCEVAKTFVPDDDNEQD